MARFLVHLEHRMGVESQPLAELVAYLSQVHQVEKLNQPPLVELEAPF